MSDLLKKTRYSLMALLVLVLAGSFSAGVYAQKKPKIIKEKKAKADAKKKVDTESSAEPDKVLYQSAMKDIQHSKYLTARLSLQTLINTYPDSEYLAKAKLAIADSFYKEGGTSNLTQAVEEYKNFIVFFPFLDEAAYAQMQVGMAHYRMMEKADRDSSQAEAAEDEFQAFLLKYPQNPLVSKAEQYLRNVQEVLAEGEFEIARFYYVKPDYRASAARLVEVTGRYPLYSQSDTALSMLGDIYMRAKQASKNEDDKNHWADLAGQCYSRILQDYPLSKLAPDAKAKLASMGMTVPKANPDAYARMKEQQEYQNHHHPNPIINFPVGMFRSGPDVYAAARSGRPNLNPPDDTVSATDVLKQGAAGPSFAVVASSAGGGAAPAVETESTGTSTADSSSTPAATAGVQILNAPGAGDSAPVIAPTVTATATPTANADPPTVAPVPAPAPSASQDTSATAQSTGSAAGTSTPAGSQQTASKADPKNESTSKKKKGLRKVIPW